MSDAASLGTVEMVLTHFCGSVRWYKQVEKQTSPNKFEDVHTS